MLLKGRGLKRKIKDYVTSIMKTIFNPGFFYDAPKKYVDFDNWVQQNKALGEVKPVYDSFSLEEQLPEIFNYQLTGRFKKYSHRTVPKAYVACIKNGRVYGRYSNSIILPDNVLAGDLSRQFGAYGGLPPELNSLIKSRLSLGSKRHLKGKVAVITTEGADNFHHWLYDAMPRIFLLSKTNLFEVVDFFIISFKGLPFQQESLKLLNLPKHKIINPQENDCLYYSADELIVPSLPSKLGTVSPWVAFFLDNLYGGSKRDFKSKRIFISRKHVTSRHITNAEEVFRLFAMYNIVEVFPEDYPVTIFSQIVRNATMIISVHGSGLSNLCFVSRNTVVIDLLAPYHQDCYYWLISNIKSARYIGFFSEGEHPSDDIDLVKNKVDNDLTIDISKLRELLTRELTNLAAIS